MLMHRRITGQLVIATTIPASSSRCANAGPYGIEAVSAGESGSMSRGNRRQLRANARIKAEAAANASGCRPSPTIPGSRSMRSMARRHPFGALGRAVQGLMAR